MADFRFWYQQDSDVLPLRYFDPLFDLLNMVRSHGDPHSCIDRLSYSVVPEYISRHLPMTKHSNVACF